MNVSHVLVSIAFREEDGVAMRTDEVSVRMCLHHVTIPRFSAIKLLHTERAVQELVRGHVFTQQVL